MTTTTAPIARFAILNVLDGDFEVHGLNCRDVDRKVSQRRTNNLWTSDLETADEVVAAEVALLQADGMDWAPEHFRVFPCCSEVGS